MNRVYGYSVEERLAVVEHIVNIAKESTKKGNITIVSTISHKLLMRDLARKALLPFMEVYLKCSVETCAERDYKGHYKKALSGELDNFIGVTEPYELSENPELILDTEHIPINECSDILFKHALRFINGSIY